MLHSCSLQGPRATASAQHTRYESISLFNFYFTSMIQFLISIIQYLIMDVIDQDIVEGMHLIMDVKDGLQDMRENGWEPLLKKSEKNL